MILRAIGGGVVGSLLSGWLLGRPGAIGGAVVGVILATR